ncbi:MAG: hypothetical protein JWM89_1050 [Acidimicrobiales bacterium]|nr:hypothetical protein [Acidimicrobiales bacterium]
MRLPDRLWVPALAAGLLALTFVGALLVRADGDPSLLVHAGAPCATPSASAADPACDGLSAAERAATPLDSHAAAAPGSLAVQAADEAFDGQFFYRLGVSPWSKDARVAGVQFDLPALRNSRWGYGALAFVASGGDPDLVPWALVGLNLAAAVAVGAIGGGLARATGRHAGWGLLLALWPGFAYSLSLDTSELVAAAFALGALLALRQRRWAGAAALFACAVLTRDTTAVVPFGVAVAGAWTWFASRRGGAPMVDPFVVPSNAGQSLAMSTIDPSVATSDESDPPLAMSTTDPPAATSDEPAGQPMETASAQERRPPEGDGSRGLAATAVGGCALAVFGVWQLVQRARFDALPLTSSGDNNLSAPLAGLVRALGHDVPPSGGTEAFRLLCIIGLVALVAAAAWCWRSSAAPLVERVAWVPAVAVVLLLNAYLWSGATAFLRASTEAGILSILVLLGSRRDRLLTLAGIGLGGLWLLTAASQVAKLA